MRSVLVALAFGAIVITGVPSARAELSLTPAATPTVAATTYALQQPAKDLNVDINVNRGGGKWYASPVWIAIGAVAAVLILLLIILAARSGGGGGTTIVKE